MEVVPDYSYAIEMNMGCHSPNRILLFLVLPAVPKLQWVLLIQEPVSSLPGSFANHVYMGLYLDGVHQRYMFPSTSL